MKPFLSGKKNLALSAAKLSGGATPAAPLQSVLDPSREGHDTPTPTIEAVKEGDKVVRLVITCGCGERMEVECIYPVGA